jgi:hypothetical protein
MDNAAANGKAEYFMQSPIGVEMYYGKQSARMPA